MTTSDHPEVLTLYTIGHSNLSAEEFLSALKTHDIRVLVDVRSAPASRYAPHFNKRELEQFLKQNQVDYRFAGEFLGGRPTDPKFYKFQEVPNADTKREEFVNLVDYVAMMRDERYLRGVNRLIDIVREHHESDSGHVAIMCSEGNPHECHRHHLITRSLIDPDLKVVTPLIQVYHILRDQKLVAAKAEEFSEQPTQKPLF